MRNRADVGPPTRRFRGIAAPAALALALAACGERVPPPFGTSPARPIDVRASLSAAEAPLMGAVTYRLDLFAENAGAGRERAVAVTPKWPDGVEATPLPDERRPWLDGQWLRKSWQLRARKLGDLVIPPALAESDGAVANSAELPLRVVSVLAGAGPEVEAPAPPFPEPDRPGPWVIVVPAVLALLLLAWLFLRRQQKRRAEPITTPVPAHIAALRALARLRQGPRATAAQIEAFYVEVSRILRVYLEERFGLHAPERTTEEFLVEAERNPALGGEQRLRLREFLHQCDLVKFAKVVPDEAVHDRTFGIAESFVEATRPDRSAA